MHRYIPILTILTILLILLICGMLLTGCENAALPGFSDTASAASSGSAAENRIAIDSTYRYTYHTLVPPEGGTFRQTLKASGGVLAEMEGFIYLQEDTVHMQFFTGSAKGRSCAADSVSGFRMPSGMPHCFRPMEKH